MRDYDDEIAAQYEAEMPPEEVAPEGDVAPAPATEPENYDAEISGDYQRENLVEDSKREILARINAQVTPEQAKQAGKLAKENETSPMYFLQNPELHADIQTVEAATTAGELAPVAKKWMADPDYHALVQLDIHGKTKWEKSKGFVAQQWATGEYIVDRGELGWKMMGGYEPNEEEQEFLDSQHHEYDYGLGMGMDVLAYGAEQIYIMGSGLPTVAKGTAGGAVTGAGTGAAVGTFLGPVGTVVGAKIGVVTGAGLGARGGFAVHSGKIQGGNAFLEYSAMRDENGELMDRDSARAAAMVVSALTGGLDMVGLDALLRTIPGGSKVASRLTGEGVKKMLLDPVGRGMLKQLGQLIARTGVGAAGETVTEMLQEFTVYAGGAAIAGINDGDWVMADGRSAYELDADALKDVGYRSFMGAIGIAGTINTARMGSDIYVTKRAEDNATALEQSILDARDSALNEADPDAQARYIDGTLEGDNETVFVDGDLAMRFFQRHDSMRELERQRPELAAEIRVAQENGGDATILVRDLMSVIAAIPDAEKLVRDIRVTPDSITAREAQANVARAADSLRAVLGEVTDGPEFEVHRAIREQLIDSGRTDTVADTEAMLIQHLANTQGEEMGMSPMDWLRWSGITVGREGDTRESSQRYMQDAQKNDIGMISAVEKAALDMRLPQWKKKKVQPHPDIAEMEGTREALREQKRGMDRSYKDQLDAVDDLAAEADPRVVDHILDEWKTEGEKIDARMPDEALSLLMRKEKVLSRPEAELLMKSRAPDAKLTDDEVQQLNAIRKKQRKALSTAKGPAIWQKLSKEQGVKKAELEWMGLEDFLMGAKEPLTREEVAAFIRNDGLNIQEVVADKESADSLKWDENEIDDPGMYDHRIEDYRDELREEGNIAEEVLAEYEDQAGEQDVESYVAENAAMEYESEVESRIDTEAEQKAEQEYKENPEKEWHNPDTGLTIRGNDDVGYNISDEYGQHIQQAYDFFEAEEAAIDHARDHDLLPSTEETAVHETYVSGDYTNYREYKIYLPDIPGEYVKEEHFDEPNILTFSRVADREAPTSLPPPDAHEFTTRRHEELTKQWIVPVDQVDLTGAEPPPTWYAKPWGDFYANLTEPQQIRVMDRWDNLNVDGHPELRSDAYQTGQKAALKTIQQMAEREAHEKFKVDELLTFFIEELQSDWHQEGREHGYEGIGGLTEEQKITMNLRLDSFKSKLQDVSADVQDTISRVLTDAESHKKVLDSTATALSAVATQSTAMADREGFTPDKARWWRNSTSGFSNDGPRYGETVRVFLEQYGDPETVRKFDDVMGMFLESQETNKILEADNYDKVPDAPFKEEAWFKLIVKKMVMHAAENDYPAIGWSNAQIHIDRWHGAGKKLFPRQYDKSLPNLMAELLGAKPVLMSADGTRAVTPLRIPDDDHPFVPGEQGFWMIELTQEMRDRINNMDMTLFQDGAKGWIDVSDDALPITLTGKANLTTFVHETGHAVLESLFKGEREHMLSSRQTQVLADLRAEYGITGRKPSVEQHELFARQFEAYLMEGKAPSKELQSTFDTIRSWMVTIYRTVKRLLGDDEQMNPEVRNIFDRLLATDAAITEVGQADMQTALDLGPENSGQLNALFDAAVEEAHATAGNRAMLDAQAQTRKSFKARRAQLTAQHTAALEALPEYQALAALRDNVWPDGTPDDLKGKLNRAAVKSQLNTTRLPKTFKNNLTVTEGGLSPDALAAVFGFDDSTVMLSEMANAPAIPGAVDQIVKAQLDREFGELDVNNKAQMAELARDAWRNEKKVEYLLAVLQSLNKRVAAHQDPASVNQALKQSAQAHVATLSMRGLQPHKYVQAERKLHIKATKAAANGQWGTVQQATIEMLFNQHAYREARNAQDEARKIQRALKVFTKEKKRGQLGKLKVGDERPYLDAMDILMELIDLRQRSYKDIDAGMRDIVATERITELTRLVDLIEANDDTAAIALPESITEARVMKNWKEFTIGELRDLSDAATTVNHAGNRQNKVRIAGIIRDLDEVTGAIVDSMQEHHVGHDYTVKYGALPDQRARAGARKVKDKLLESLLKMEFQFMDMDGGKRGATIKALFDPIAEAQEDNRRLKVEMAEKLKELQDRFVDKDWNDRMNESVPDFLGYDGFTKRSLFALLLNLGSESNSFKVLAGIEQVTGKGWDRADVLEAMQIHLTKKDFQYAQHLLDYTSRLWGRISHTQQEASGLKPKKVEGLAFEAHGQDFAGGYYPIAYDRDQMNSLQQSIVVVPQEQANALWEAPLVRKNVSRGFTESRTSFTAPVRLDLGVMGEHINETIDFVTYYEPIAAAWKIINRENFSKEFKRNYGAKRYAGLTGWLQGVANDGRAPESNAAGVAWLDAALGKTNSMATYGTYAFNMRSAMKQWSGITSSIYLLKGHVAHGLKGALQSQSESEPAHTHSYELEALRTNMNQALREAQRQTFEIQPDGKYKVFMDAHGFQFMAMAQHQVNVVTWYAGLHQAHEMGLAGNAAIHHADGAVRQTQGAAGPKDLAAFQRGGQMARAMGFGMSWFITSNGLKYSRGRAVQRTTAEHGMTKGMAEGAVASMWYLIAVAYGAGLGNMFFDMLVDKASGAEDDDIDWEAWFLAETLTAGVGGIPIAREAPSVVAGFGANPMSGSAKQLERSMDAVGIGVDAATGDFDGLTKAEFKALATIPAWFLPVPVNALGDVYVRVAGDD